MANESILVDHTHFFTGDTHFGHVGILNFAMRPQSDIQAHDRDLVAHWNSVVAPTDTVWHLGDFAGEDVALKDAETIFKRLNGIKRLIVGNHDHEEIVTGLEWASVDQIRTVVTKEGTKIVLCHYPMREWNGFFSGDIHFHGHTHGRLSSSRLTWDCGFDHQGFVPQTASAILDKMTGLSRRNFDGVLVE